SGIQVAPDCFIKWEHLCLQLTTPLSSRGGSGSCGHENATCPRGLLVCSLALADRSRENPFGGVAGEAFRSGEALTSCCRLAPPRPDPELVTSRGGAGSHPTSDHQLSPSRASL